MKLMNFVAPKSVFEFGTYRGDTTRFMLHNLDFEQGHAPRIVTLDLAEDEGVSFEGTDGDLASHALAEKPKYLSSERADHVEQVYCDSMIFDPTPYQNSMDMIFVDANHAEDYVRNDTEKAFVMARDGHSCIIWHDYKNKQFPGLTRYLDELSEKHPAMVHVEETMMVVLPLMDMDFKPGVNGLFF